MPVTYLPDILTAAEVASLMNVTSETIRRWVREDYLHGHKTNKGMHFFTRAEVERFRKQREG